MSSVTVIQHPSTLTARKAQGPPPSCQQCGAEIPYTTLSAAAEDAQRRISELEAQVRILTGKATAAVDKLADYEDQLHQLKSTQTQNSSSSPRSNSPQITMQPPSRPQSSLTPPLPSPPPAPQQPGKMLRFPSSLTNLLRPPSAPATPGVAATSSSSPPPDCPPEIMARLSQEQALRQAAEHKLTNSAQELEELSAQLFTEANEMVSQERQARARLEKRVEILERRDREKRDRLGELERRVGRVERVRGILGGYA